MALRCVKHMALQHPLHMEIFVGKTSANGELSIAHVWLQGGKPNFLVAQIAGDFSLWKSVIIRDYHPKYV